jgi:hypothetical protein
MPQPVSYNPGTPVSGSIQENSISYVVDGQNRNYRGGFGGLSWMSEVPAENNVIFIGNSTSLGRGPANIPLFYPAYNNSSANIVYAANTLPGSPRNFTTTGSAYNWAVTNNFFINNSNNPIPRIDADGLSFYVDANQPTSYPQTGTSWYDLSGFNRNSTLTNGPTFNSNGWIEFDGADDRSATSFGFLSNSESHEAWVYCKGNVSSYNMFMGIVLPYYGFWQGNQYIVQDSIGGNQVGYIAGSLSLNRWYHFLNTRSYNGTNTTLTTYINGTLSNQSTYSGAPSVYGGTWTLGNWDVSVGASYPFYGDISGVKFYTKALTLTEVKQNYFQSNIVQDGLVLMVDANNLVSYPRSGTTLYNLTSSISTVTGSLINGPTYGVENGGSIVFDGVDDYIDFNNLAGTLISNPSLNSNIISFSCWVLVSNPGSYYIISSGGQTGSTGVAFSYQNGSPFVSVQGNNFDCFININPSDFPLNTWINFAFVGNGSNLTVYKNGVYLTAQNYGSNALSDTYTILSLGRPNNFTGLTLGGKLAQVMFYNKALTPSEVQQNYQATKDKFQGQQIVTSGLVLNLDAANKDSYPGTGTTWYDLSGNGNNGILQNGPLFIPNQNNGVLSFDGTDDFGTAGNFFTYQAFTINLWIRPGSSQTTYADIIDNNHTGTQNWVCQQDVGSLNQYNFVVFGSAGQTSATGNFTLTSNTWVNLVFTYDGDKVRGYNNGTLFATGASLGTTINYVAPTFNIGNWNLGGRNWNGQYGLINAYNRALSATEIAQNYNATKGRFGL